MGVSQTVELQISASREFRRSLNVQLDSMDRAIQPWRDGFHLFVEDFYRSNQWDRTRFGFHQAVDMQVLDEFSLVNISRQIEQQARHFLQGDVLSIHRNAIGEALSKRMNVKLVQFSKTALVSNAALSALCLALCIFKRKDSRKIDRKMLTQRLAPGLTLHCYGCSSLAMSSLHAHGSTVLMSKIGYELVWSAGQEQAERGRNFLNVCVVQLESLESQVRLFSHELESTSGLHGNSNVNARSDIKRLRQLEKVLTQYRAQVDTLSRTYNKGVTDYL